MTPAAVAFALSVPAPVFKKLILMLKQILFGTVLVSAVFLSACSDNAATGPDPAGFDREAMLNNWADNIIIPSYQDFAQSTATLKEAGIAFRDQPTVENVQRLRSSWKDAYLTWQRVSMFETGPAMDVRLRNNMNVYPADTSGIKNNIESGSYDLSLASENNRQGFPALDYLINGAAAPDTAVASLYAERPEYGAYLADLTGRADSLTRRVLGLWQNGYRETFISKSGNTAGSSIDMLVNDYLQYYEKALRAGKVGIPAGVFSNNPLPGNVEAYYQRDFSRELLLESLQATRNFFNGVDAGNTGQSGPSLNQYLTYLNAAKDDTALAALINETFDAARTQIQSLNPDFVQQIEENNTEMLTTYDRLQENVILMKVDMLQALNINVDYVDADGD
jgi:hypothetical protein